MARAVTPTSTVGHYLAPPAARSQIHSMIDLGPSHCWSTSVGISIPGVRTQSVVDTVHLGSQESLLDLLRICQLYLHCIVSALST
jgi:hypothetical protein